MKRDALKYIDNIIDHIEHALKVAQRSMTEELQMRALTEGFQGFLTTKKIPVAEEIIRFQYWQLSQ